MNHLSTIKPSNIEIINTYECPNCQTIVNVIKTVRNGEEVTVDKCLGCENKRLVEECTNYYIEREARKAEMLFEKYSVVTSDVEQANFETYEPKNEEQRLAKNGAKWYAENFHDLNKGFHSLLFQGSYGLGKSHLAHSICKVLKDKGVSAIFINVPELLNMIKGTFNRNSKISENDLLKAISEVRLLVLDDIGAEYIKKDENGSESWATDKLFQIVNSRVNKPTIFTTNYTSADLTKKYGTHGGRIVSRMMQGTKVIKLSGDDYRMKGF